MGDKTMFEGNLDNLPEQESLVVRVFLSSTFTGKIENFSFRLTTASADLQQQQIYFFNDFRVGDLALASGKTRINIDVYLNPRLNPSKAVMICMI